MTQLNEARGSCLISQNLRKKILDCLIVPSTTDLRLNDDGTFKNKILEGQIQPSSYEPMLSNRIYILNPEVGGIFRPEVHEDIYKTLLKLPKTQRKDYDITDGFEIKKGYSYLIPLEDRVVLSHNEHIISSPKSSLGRLFLHTRLLADHNTCFNEIHHQYENEHKLQLWLLIQPTFNLIVYQNLSLNQLRFFSGYDARLTDLEIIEESKKNPLLYRLKNNQLVPIPIEDMVVYEGVQIHIDLQGEYTKGIVGLKARKNNPNPIDLKGVGEYNAEEYFEPIISGKDITVKEGDSYLIVTKEILKIPSHLSSEMEDHSDKAVHGPLHFAGFIDPGFNGNLVAEVQPKEQAEMKLTDQTPISNLIFYRSSEVPDKIYSKEIGSNYQNQKGVRISKFFKDIDYTTIAGEYKKLERIVLTLPTTILKAHRKIPEGYEPILLPERALKFYKTLIADEAIFHKRRDCETDENILQIIPYILIFGTNKTIFSYIRYAGENLDIYGDRRLHNKHSIGVGGHIKKEDAPNYIQKCLERELSEEVTFEGNHSDPVLVGTLLATEKEVDRVHFGLVFAIVTERNVESKEQALIKYEMAPIDKLAEDLNYAKKYNAETETWSKILMPWLPIIYDRYIDNQTNLSKALSGPKPHPDLH